MKIKSVHNEIFIFDSSKMLKVENKHFNAHLSPHFLRYEFNVWNVHGIMNASGLLQSK